MARGQRNLQAVAPPAEPAPPADPAADQPRARRGRAPVPANELAIERRLVALRKQRDDAPERSEARRDIVEHIRQLTAELGTMKAHRVLEPRVSAVLQKLDQIGNVARGNYSLPPEDVDFMFADIHRKADAIRALFAPGKQVAGKPQFTFNRIRSGQ